METVNLEAIVGINNTQNGSGTLNRENLNALLKQYQTYTEKRIELKKSTMERLLLWKRHVWMLNYKGIDGN